MTNQNQPKNPEKTTPNSETLYQILGQSLTLKRYPLRKGEGLRAWDAADEYALQHLAEMHPEALSGNILVVNDGFGALSLPLLEQARSIFLLSDSVNAQQNIKENIQENHLDLTKLSMLNGEEIETESSLSHDINTLIIKIPKSLGQLEYNLQQIAPRLTPETKVIGTGMVKNIHRSTLALFEQYIGQTTTSLAKKKARLVFSEPQDDMDTVDQTQNVNRFYARIYCFLFSYYRTGKNHSRSRLWNRSTGYCSRIKSTRSTGAFCR